MIQAEFTPLIEEQINHRTVAKSSIEPKSSQKNIYKEWFRLYTALLEGEELPILCSVTGQPAVILGISTSVSYN